MCKHIDRKEIFTIYVTSLKGIQNKISQQHLLRICVPGRNPIAMSWDWWSAQQPVSLQPRAQCIHHKQHQPHVHLESATAAKSNSKMRGELVRTAGHAIAVLVTRTVFHATWQIRTIIAASARWR